jgi:ribosome biogenesis protein YTM1
MATYDGDDKTIQVRFKTKETQYAVTETPFAVPERLTRLGLSQVINHLLGTGKSIQMSFI